MDIIKEGRKMGSLQTSLILLKVSVNTELETRSRGIQERE